MLLSHMTLAAQQEVEKTVCKFSAMPACCLSPALLEELASEQVLFPIQNDLCTNFTTINDCIFFKNWSVPDAACLSSSRRKKREVTITNLRETLG